MTTTFPRAATRRWVLIDAKDQVLGRLASQIATLLRGKHRAVYTPFMDTGDFVVVVNAREVALTGQKRTQKHYERYSGYPSGRTLQRAADVLATRPERALREAVKGMMPDGPLARRQLAKLKIFPGPDHPHGAQQPQTVTLARNGMRGVHG